MTNPFEQKPYDSSQFIENPEPRCACLLLLDVSGSMTGEPLKQLNQGLLQFKDELYSDALASKRVEIGIISFGPVNIVNDFVGVNDWFVPTLKAQGSTPMGEAIERGISLLSDRKDIYKQNGVSYYRPWIFLITDGSPTDKWSRAAQLIKEGEASKSFSFFAVGVDGADMGILSQLATREPLSLKDTRFTELFKWLSASLSSVSQSNPGDVVPLASPKGWASI